MAQLVTDNIAAFHRGNALARCQQIFARQRSADEPWLLGEDHRFLMDLIAHHPAHALDVLSDEVIGSATITFLNMDCFVVLYHDGGEVMVDHLKCIDVMFD